jgi:hypothetical protein
MYKVVYKNVIIDILTKPIYCMCFPDTGFKLRTDETSANCIISSNGEEAYHLAGRSPFLPENYKAVELVPIDKDEFDYLKSLTIEGEPIEFDIDELKATKIAEVSKKSEATIHAGTDVTLSDGKTYHFSFSDQDQFQIGFLATAAKNAAMLETMGLPTNETGKDYPWHADGGDCIFYSRKDMIVIGTVMQNYITYHNSYFHALRNYIYALTKPLAIVDLYYGVEVPKIYWGEVYNYANS